MIAVDAARWWGPLGYLYRNTPGNLLASLLWIVPGVAYARWKAIPAAKAHLEERLHAHHEATIAALKEQS